MHIAEARGFVAGTERRYDLIQLPLLDSFAAQRRHASLHESFVYTVEAFGTYLDHLEARRLSRDHALAEAAAARQPEAAPDGDRGARGAAAWRSPGASSRCIRGWDTTTLLVKNGALTRGRRRADPRASPQERSFDLAYHPGIGADEANRYNVLQQPSFYEGAQALLGPDREGFVARYKFDLRPATDDRPYFFDFFTWRALPEVAIAGGAVGRRRCWTGAI